MFVMNLTEQELLIIHQCPTTSWKTIIVSDRILEGEKLVDGEICYKSCTDKIQIEFRLIDSIGYCRKIYTCISLFDDYYTSCVSLYSAILKLIARNCIREMFLIGLADPNSTFIRYSISI